jgi:Rrf2 family protein
MDLIRRNTDYAIRLVSALALKYDTGQVLSARTLSQANHVPYTLACKVLQKYQKAGIIKSVMGPRGGFCLARRPSEITILELIEMIQGDVRVNRCLAFPPTCPIKNCPLHPKLLGLQEEIQRYLGHTTLADLIKT